MHIHILDVSVIDACIFIYRYIMSVCWQACDSMTKWIIRRSYFHLSLSLYYIYIYTCRRVLVPESGSPVQERVLLLLDHHLYSLLHVSHRVVGLLLARRQRRAGSRLARSHHAPHDGDANDGYQQLSSARLLHQSKIIIYSFFVTH